MGLRSNYYKKPKIQIYYNGKDKTQEMAWISITINDYENSQTDTANISLKWDNAKPRLKDNITIYANAAWLGSFNITKIKYNYKQSYEIEAIAADFCNGFKEKKNRSFQKLSYKEIIETIAKENNYKTKIDFKRAEQIIDVLEQYDMSDSAFLNKIATDNELIFTIKNGYIIFLERHSGNGQRLTYDLNADDCFSFNYEELATTNYKSCEVKYRNIATASDEVVRVGDGEPVLRLTSLADSKDSALKLAEAKLKKQTNNIITGSFETSGVAFSAGAHINLIINGEIFKKTLKKITHKIDKNWTTSAEFY